MAVHADDAVMRTGHAHIGDEGGALRQHMLVRGGDVGVRAHNRCDAPVEIPAQGDFFAGGLGVHVDEDECDVGRELGELGVGFAKRIVDCRQKHAALQVQDGDT